MRYRVSLSIVTSLLLAAAALAAPTQAAEDNEVRIGYWSSGVSLGFGALLEAGEFMQKEGLTVEYVKFPDVNAPTKAMAANAIDFAIGASAGGALSVAADGLPMRIMLATQVAELSFVVLEDSPIKSISDLKGKKIGMSPPGSATAAITAAILDQNFGLKAGDITVVPGNDSRLAQFLSQKDVDAVAIRSVTIAQLPDLKLRRIGEFRDEWKKMTKQDSPPILAVGLVRQEWLDKHPQGAVKVVRAMRQAYEYGRTNKSAVANALMKSANLPQADATAYANLWDGIYTVSLTPADIDSLKQQFDIFKGVGAVKGTLPEKAFAPEPFQAAIAKP